MQHIFGIDINKINKDDLIYLLEYEVVEDKRLEYKGAFEPNNPEWKRKFLKVISSFANTSGGLLIYGISEEKGVPKKFEPLDIEDFDKTRIILQDIVRSRTEPIIPNLEVVTVDILDENNIVLIIKVLKSWNGPYRVKMNGKREFYIRIDGKSTEMDILELRNALTCQKHCLKKLQISNKIEFQIYYLTIHRSLSMKAQKQFCT